VTQLLRGAHFASHSLWTAWLCFSLSAAVWHIAAATTPMRHTAWHGIDPRRRRTPAA
jgi:membrane-associated PAP2 superfamily phosphatase